MTFDNTNRKDLREAEKASKLADSNRIAYTRTIMSTIFGRAWMYSLLLDCNVFHTPFVAGMSDVTSFNCGKQNIGLRLFGDVAAHCPNEYTLMMTEASIQEQAHGRRTESASDTDGRPSTGNRRDTPEPSDRYGLDKDGFISDASDGSDQDDGYVEGPINQG